jgi:hypothetical protein
MISNCIWSTSTVPGWSKSLPKAFSIHSPCFRPTAKKSPGASNRKNNGTRDTNVFVADWVGLVMNDE